MATLRVMRLILSALLWLSLLPALPVGAEGARYRDKDWSEALHDTCGLPRPDSVRWVTQGGARALAFELRPGDVGGCIGDNRARHRAPYWERAELAQRPKLHRDGAYRISFNVQLPDGFTGGRETFFQIHAWAQNCEAYPPVMLMMDDGHLVLRALRGVKQARGKKGSHKAYHLQQMTVASFRDAPRSVVLGYFPASGRLSLGIDGQVLLRDIPVEIAPCGAPHLKLGIYRPGKGVGVSRAIFDEINVLPSQ